MKVIKFALPTVLAVIIIIILSLMLYQKDQELKNIKIRSYLEFTHATDEVSIFGEDANKEEINKSFTHLENSYYHNIGRFHRMSYSNDSFFEEVGDFVEEQDEINWELLNQYLASIDWKIGELIRSENGAVNDKEMNQFMEGLREEFYELFPNGELQNWIKILESNRNRFKTVLPLNRHLLIE